MMYEHNYQNNIQALQGVDPQLAQKIIAASRAESFELDVIDEDYQLYNITDQMRGEALFANIVDELKETLTYLKRKREHDFLYFFGIANAYALPTLLANPKHQRLVVIEPEPELIFVAFHLYDLSQAITQRRLILFDVKEFDFAQAVNLFVQGNAKIYARSFELLPMAHYYERYFHDEILRINKILLDGLSHNITTSGNDITDSLIGVAHHIRHLKQMIEAPAFKSLQTAKNSEWAVVVSTGPSLKKQLPMLKKLADHVTIISVDASLPILEQEGIKPDLVTSIERVELTSEFFKRTSEAFHKDITFVCASLEHDATLDAIRGTKLLVMRPFHYNHYFDLPEYGYLGSGMSAANMAHELAFAMGYDNCILIGQDLAYADDGNSHAEGHVFGSNEIDPKEREQFEVTAYGGKGIAKTQMAWKLFLGFFEYTVALHKDIMTTYNATEGGARIHGTIEKPFTQLADEIMRTSVLKKPIKLPSNDPAIITQNLAQTQEKIVRILKEGYELKESIEAAFVALSSACKELEGLSREDFIHHFDDATIMHLLEHIGGIRQYIETNTIYQEFFADVIQSTMLHLELDVGNIKVRYVENKETNREKAMDWIVIHQLWLFQVAGSISNTLDLVMENNPFDIDFEKAFAELPQERPSCPATC